MTSWLLIFRSLVFHRRIHLAVALGVAAATAVLTGALLVGDSVRGSLRDLALDRLGEIDQILVAPHFFRSELANEVAGDPNFARSYGIATPAIVFPTATAERIGENGGRAANVTVLSTREDFWKLARDGESLPQPPKAGEVLLNATLASDLKAKVGDTVVLRFPKVGGVPEDSALGRTEDRLAVLPELKVIGVLPDEGLGRFSLQPTQISPRNAYVDLSAMQDALQEPDQANAIFVGRGTEFVRSERPAADGIDVVGEALKPRLDDYGLHLKHVRRTFGEGDEQKRIYDYHTLTSDRMLLDSAAEREALRAFEKHQPQAVLTYLANLIQKIPAGNDAAGESGKEAAKGIPYSTITAIDPARGGPLVDESGKPLPPLKDDEIVVTSWAANDQNLKLGDRVRVTYFEPETTHGNEKERSTEFRVAAIVPLTEPSEPADRRKEAVYDEPPTAANDPDLTPQVKGITDQASIEDWDAPFPFDYSIIRPQDDEYWENHRATPKAYVSLKTGQKLWGSRFGNATSVRLPGGEAKGQKGQEASGEADVDDSLQTEFLAQLAKDRESLGMEFVPIRQRSLAAAAGTTPFDVLFLLLSMFVIGAAMLLVWLLFRLGVDQRASEVGLLLAQGWSRGKTGSLLTREGLIVAAAGAAIGLLGGIAYAWLMIQGLTTWWVDAIASPFLRLHVSGRSLAIGYFAGLIVCSVTIWFSLRALRHPSVRQLLAGETTAAPKKSYSGGAETGRRFSIGLLVAAGLYVVAVALAILAVRLSAEAQAGSFMAAGAAVLAATLILVYRQLRDGPTGSEQAHRLATSGLSRLAMRSAGRNAGRSVATIALVASATFLIVAVSSFRLDPTSEGTADFDLLGETSQPIFADLDSEKGRADALGNSAAELKGSTVLSLRLQGGDDASCRNLYQPAQPRVLGVPPAMIEHFDDPQRPAFRFSASADADEATKANPWRLLAEPVAKGEPLPVILDQNTALYSLRLYGGVGSTFSFTYPGENTVTFRIVGMLANSVLQGNLLIGEQNFEKTFPGVSGYRVFLIDAPAGAEAKVAESLEKSLADEGFDAVDAQRRLAELLSVQNTYISTFQSLGALGLILGTFGLAAVQLRSVFERRKELALLRAAGFRRARLGELVMLENLVLLLGGLATGVFSALVTVLPHWFVGGAQVPFLTLSIMLGVVLIVGVLTGLLAVRATLNAPLVAALRGE
jgi:putative ABC transport system permease protein